jgi:hypothetical protein
MRQHFGAESAIEPVTQPASILKPTIGLASPLVEPCHGG